MAANSYMANDVSEKDFFSTTFTINKPKLRVDPMEEEKSEVVVPNRPPNPAEENLPNSQTPLPPAAAARPPPHSKKRKSADYVDNPNAHYFKLRAIVRDLRPHFIEVLRTPDFRTSKAAHEIRKKMKRVMDVCKKMTIETASIEMSKKPYESETVLVEDQDGQKLVDSTRHPDQVPEKSAELPLSGNNSEKLEDGQIHGSYVVGGSNLGWNFIMYPNNKTVYYGVSKESRQNSMKTKDTL